MDGLSPHVVARLDALQLADRARLVSAAGALWFLNTHTHARFIEAYGGVARAHCAPTVQMAYAVVADGIDEIVLLCEPRDNRVLRTLETLYGRSAPFKADELPAALWCAAHPWPPPPPPTAAVLAAAAAAAALPVLPRRWKAAQRCAVQAEEGVWLVPVAAGPADRHAVGFTAVAVAAPRVQIAAAVRLLRAAWGHPLPLHAYTGVDGRSVVTGPLATVHDVQWLGTASAQLQWAALWRQRKAAPLSPASLVHALDGGAGAWPLYAAARLLLVMAAGRRRQQYAERYRAHTPLSANARILEMIAPAARLVRRPLRTVAALVEVGARRYVTSGALNALNGFLAEPTGWTRAEIETAHPELWHVRLDLDAQEKEYRNDRAALVYGPGARYLSETARAVSLYVYVAAFVLDARTLASPRGRAVAVAILDTMHTDTEFCPLIKSERAVDDDGVVHAVRTAWRCIDAEPDDATAPLPQNTFPLARAVVSAGGVSLLNAPQALRDAVCALGDEAIDDALQPPGAL